ncbi:MAG: sigma-70 family RNA polymerase sigma factor [Bacteroidales bacterium]|nr:sigma-70 family RNA polymerase sigma factor [Bacteroides sp.]MCM1502531.1 sigma-70 family RNA polymerase sigma factor [Bacteroidales bacterium]
MSEDHILIARMNAGSKKAFASLYDKYVSMVYGYVHSILKDTTIAEDVTQFCFMKLWEHRSNIAPDRNLPAWLYVTARNAVYKEARRQVTVTRYVEHALCTMDAHEAAKVSDFDIRIIEAEVRRVIDSLPESRRRIYLMKMKDGMTTAQIAEALDISPKTVDNQIARVKELLRKHIGELVMLALFIF